MSLNFNCHVFFLQIFSLFDSSVLYICVLLVLVSFVLHGPCIMSSLHSFTFTAVSFAFIFIIGEYFNFCWRLCFVFVFEVNQSTAMLFFTV